jgi:hypothetical protein
MRKPALHCLILGAALLTSLLGLAVLSPGWLNGVAYSTAWISAGGLLLILASLPFRSFGLVSVVPAFWFATGITWLAFVLYDLGFPRPAGVVFFMARFLGPYGVQPFGIAGLVIYGALNILGWLLVVLPVVSLLERGMKRRRQREAAGAV